MTDVIAGERQFAETIGMSSNPSFADTSGRPVREARFRLTSDNPFSVIYQSPESVVAGPVRGEPLHNGEVLTLARACAALGAGHINLCIASVTGRDGTLGLIHGLKGIPGITKVSLTTMGCDLAGHAGDLVDAGLDELRINLDTLRVGRYAKITGTGLLEGALQSFREALASPLPVVRINMVVMRGVNADELDDYAEMILESRARVCFYELVPYSWAGWMKDAVFDSDTILADIRTRTSMVECKDREDAEVVWYRHPDHPGLFGIVPNLSERRCSGCDRIRFTEDGRVQACRYSVPDDRLVVSMRAGGSDADIEKAAREALADKPRERPGIAGLQEIALACRS